VLPVRPLRLPRVRLSYAAPFFFSPIAPVPLAALAGLAVVLRAGAVVFAAARWRNSGRLGRVRVGVAAVAVLLVLVVAPVVAAVLRAAGFATVVVFAM
jgi:hypothetical protein